MVTASSDSLNKPGGRAFACAVVDAYYTVCKLMEGAETRDRTLTAMGKRFAGLGFGAVVTLAITIPIVNLFVIPAAVAGATVFWVDQLKDG